MSNNSITPRERVLTALRHEQPDRIPVDFLATPEIWQHLVDTIQPDIEAVREIRLFRSNLGSHSATF